MKETFVTFENQGQKLSGVLHTPKGRTDCAIIFAHGFTGHKREVQIVNATRKLAENGFAVLRFDFRGSGESDGLFRNMTISEEVSDLEKAIDFMKNMGYRKLGLVGHSLGGTVVILARKNDVSTIILWAPALAPLKTFTQLFGKYTKFIEKRGYSITCWDGKAMEFILGNAFWKEVKNKFPTVLDYFLNLKMPKTVIYGGEDWRWLKIYVPKYLQKLQQPDNNLKIIKNADHSFSKYEYEKQLIDYTVKWFKKWLK
jgi:esterase/lipase